jgi:hypothetical protein
VDELNQAAHAKAARVKEAYRKLREEIVPEYRQLCSRAKPWAPNLCVKSWAPDRGMIAGVYDEGMHGGDFEKMWTNPSMDRVLDALEHGIRVYVAYPGAQRLAWATDVEGFVKVWTQQKGKAALARGG